MRSIKCVIIGDGCIGKTEMVMGFANNTFSSEYVSTIFDYYSTNCSLNDKNISMQLWDTSGQEEYARFRPLCYSEADIFIICFSLVSPYSYENVEYNWIQELKQHNPDVPYILVGLKSDLRDDFHKMNDEFRAKGYSPISSIQGLDLMRKIGAHEYIECSAKNPSSLQNVFKSAATIVLQHNIVDQQNANNFAENCCLLI